MIRKVYLDHNASTPVHPDVIQAMLPYFAERFGNPSSVHGFGREARDGSGLEHRVGIHGQKQIAAGKSGGSVYCRAAAAARAMADDHVHQAQRVPALRDGARFIG